jgi:hypothetical protein
MCKLAETSETSIAVVFLVMNLEKLLKAALLNFFVCFGPLLESFSVIKTANGYAWAPDELHLLEFYGA